MRVRLLAVVLVLGSVLVPGAYASDTDRAAGEWAMTIEPSALYGTPKEDAEIWGSVPANAPLQILRYEGEYAYVYEPIGRGEAYVPSAILTPGEAPSRYVLMAPPTMLEQFSTRGVVTDDAFLRLYPTFADDAVQRALRPTTWLQLHAIVQGEDNSQWYLTDSGYLPVDAVFVPDRSDQFAGRWLDVDLNTPTRVTAYEGGEPVGSFLAIRGTARWPTPVGVFTILRRVANETMNSESIGIPRGSPGGYFLTNVLFTQYFTGDGASFHYNYWSANWGLPGSHGCLGLTYGDSAWLWEWARVGTPISIHY